VTAGDKPSLIQASNGGLLTVIGVRPFGRCSRFVKLSANTCAFYGVRSPRTERLFETPLVLISTNAEPLLAGAGASRRTAGPSPSRRHAAECLVAFGSTMKIICTKRKWTHTPTMPASKLIKVCMDNGLIPSYWQAHLANRQYLQGLLEASVPTLVRRHVAM
jgi:hypothetical protein